MVPQIMASAIDSRLLIAGAAVIILIGVVYTILRNKKIKDNGIDAQAVVTRIDIERDRAGSFEDSSDTEKYIVQYVNAEGQTVEAVLANPPARAVVGTQLKVKYLPEKPKLVVYVKE